MSNRLHNVAINRISYSPDTSCPGTPPSSFTDGGFILQQRRSELFTTDRSGVDIARAAKSARSDLLSTPPNTPVINAGQIPTTTKLGEKDIRERLGENGGRGSSKGPKQGGSGGDASSQKTSENSTSGAVGGGEGKVLMLYM